MRDGINNVLDDVLGYGVMREFGHERDLWRLRTRPDGVLAETRSNVRRKGRTRQPRCRVMGPTSEGTKHAGKHKRGGRSHEPASSASFARNTPAC